MSASRRGFITAVGAAIGSGGVFELSPQESAPRLKQGAKVRAFFVYPPSRTIANDPAGWWSWPGNEFDAEGRQKRYTLALAGMERKLGMRIEVAPDPVGSAEEAQRAAAAIRDAKPDGVLVVLFHNFALAHADALLKAAAEAAAPAVFFSGLGVKHGPVTQYRRPGLYFIQSLDNLDAIEYGMRMIQTRKRLAQCRLLSVTDTKQPDEIVEPFLGIQVRTVAFSRYAAEFAKVPMGDQARQFIDGMLSGAREIRGVTREAMENAARAHLALKRLLTAEDADGVAMNCLRRGMLKPCMSFAALNSELIPAACENDLAAAYTQMLGQSLTGRPGFQHNPAYETERNHYYASHCTCSPKLRGPAGAALPYLLRRFAHTNEGSCAVQVFWNPGEAVTMTRYYPGQEPALDVYAGRVAVSHPMPPAAGCTTNVEIQITDRDDALAVRGHHNVLFCGDYARRLRLFAQLYGMKLADTGYRGPWPL